MATEFLGDAKGGDFCILVENYKKVAISGLKLAIFKDFFNNIFFFKDGESLRESLLKFGIKSLVSGCFF